MDDDFDFEREIFEAHRALRARLAAGDPESRRMVYTWCEGAATEILRYLANGHVTVSATADGLWEEPDPAANDWRYCVLDGDSILVDFRADGSWTTRDGRQASWFGVIEGGPESIGRSIAHHLGLPRRPLHPRHRAQVQDVPEDSRGPDKTGHRASQSGVEDVSEPRRF